MATAAMTTTQAYEVIVVGGSFAGLSAAMQLARARRRVCVVDAGQPRNRFAAASHGFFGQDGEPPLAMIEQARRKLAAYPTVGFVQGTVVSATAQQRAGSPENGFEVVLDDGATLEAHKLVLAFGVQDGLPEIAGLRERWGASVLHCPYCHGYEFAGQRLGVLYHSAGSAMHAQLIADWGPTTLFLNGDTTLESAERERLQALGITIEPAPIAALDARARHCRACACRPPVAVMRAWYRWMRCMWQPPPALPARWPSSWAARSTMGPWALTSAPMPTRRPPCPACMPLAT